ncbi:MAG TPA: DoxX family protein [Chitinophagaceae bacterium]|nr:DoxX family protein [Chitinophagaceae bacterium]HUM65061.1 DoxX family protein [Chitinophagaceae bacterium]
MNKLFSIDPIWPESGLAFIRIVVGIFMILHGAEIFNEETMRSYLTWMSSPLYMIYFGKAAELIAGIMLALGFLTRLASVVLILTMLYISVFVGKGRIWYEDQHPFMFVLLGLVFFFLGPGRFSVDWLLNRRKADRSAK